MEWEWVVFNFAVPLVFLMICRFLCAADNYVLNVTRDTTEIGREYYKDDNNKRCYRICVVPPKRKFYKMNKSRHFLISFLLQEDEVELRVIILSAISHIFALFLIVCVLIVMFTNYEFSRLFVFINFCIGLFIIFMMLWYAEFRNKSIWRSFCFWKRKK